MYEPISLNERIIRMTKGIGMIEIISVGFPLDQPAEIRYEFEGKQCVEIVPFNRYMWPEYMMNDIEDAISKRVDGIRFERAISDIALHKDVSEIVEVFKKMSREDRKELHKIIEGIK